MSSASALTETKPADSHVVGSQWSRQTMTSESMLSPHLASLLAAQLLVAQSPELVAFRHALIHDAVYSTVLHRDRRRFHEAVAQTLEAMHRHSEADMRAHAADIAQHYFEAEQWHKAQQYALLAGEQAQQVYAQREAILHFARAVEAAQRAGQVPPADLYHKRGQSFETLGEFDAAQADYVQSGDSARTLHDPAGEWQSLIDLGFLWASRDYAQTGAYFERALELARAHGDPLTLA
ncbi:MAG: hypothetical protein LC737_00905, partial [Chloroflexi bacterium]|nr:hypothetical protein [Chloroflexota bacterium]